MTERIDGLRLHELLRGGYARLHANAQTVDRLNVFPVPDGDTGTNMSLTLRGAVTVETQSAACELLRAASRGALLSARGNSGVILSQFLRGLSEGVQEKKTLSTADFALALQSATDCAYRAVIHPTEGTMLTVMRETSEALCTAPTDFEGFFALLLAQMRASLARTPELLPVLKEAGVIDSGGAGLVYIFEGMDAALRGEAADLAEALPDAPAPAAASGEEEFGYCTEFILQLSLRENFTLSTLIEHLETLGNSIVAVQDGELVKVHVHTFKPEDALAYAHRFGEFVNIKIENMSVQHNEILQRTRKKYALVAVASGSGMHACFREMGVDAIVEGGQTQNPSAQDFLRAFASLNAEHIVVLPNNSNILLTARQAAQMYQGAQMHVIPTRTPAEGYSALTMMEPGSETIDAFIQSLTQCLSGVTTGYVTTATRDCVLGGVQARRGQYIALAAEQMLAASDDRLSAAMALFAQLPNMPDNQVLTVFFGEGVPQEEAEALQDALSRRWPLLEIGLVDGTQPVYDYIFCIE